MATRMQQRRGTAAQWTSANPILAAGEIGFETDTGKFKMGNGSSAWSALSYFADSSDFDTTAIEATIDTKVATAVDNLVSGAPAALNTLNELASAIDNNSTYASTITGILLTKATIAQVDAHEAQTTSVHGIADTSALETQTGAQNKANAAEAAAIAAAALDATAKATDAETNAVATAAADATSKANAAQAAAISAAEADALTKANAAEAAAISAAAADALTKANAAEAAAIAAAALDATAKATDAETNAVAAISPAISGHNSDTTGVHGITDTSLLATTTDVSTAQSAAQGYADSAVSAHNSDETNVHGIADTADLVLTTDARLSDERTPVDGSVTTAKIATGGIAQSAVTNLTTDLSAKATLVSPALTGTPTAPTAAAGTDTTQIATTAFVKKAVDDLVAAAPGALNTLDELAAALGDDANFATTVTNSLATKASTTDLNNALLYSFNNKTSSYTLALSDATNMVEMDSSSTTTVTVPTNASVAFSVGATIDIFQKGSGQVTIAAASGVTIYATPGLKLRAQYSGATLIKRDTNTWILTGDLVA